MISLKHIITKRCVLFRFLVVVILKHFGNILTKQTQKVEQTFIFELLFLHIFGICLEYLDSDEVLKGFELCLNETLNKIDYQFFMSDQFLVLRLLVIKVVLVKCLLDVTIINYISFLVNKGC